MTQNMGLLPFSSHGVDQQQIPNGIEGLTSYGNFELSKSVAMPTTYTSNGGQFPIQVHNRLEDSYRKAIIDDNSKSSSGSKTHKCNW